MSTQRGKVITAPHRLNRVLLLLVAWLFIAAGGAGIAAALGAFGIPLEKHSLYDNPPGRYVGAHGNWLWPVAAAVSVVIAGFALRWLAAQISIQRAGSIRIASRSGRGNTTLRAGALTDVVADQISRYHGVTGARAHLLGEPGDERLAITVTVADRVPFIPLRERIERDAAGAARTALGDPRFPIVLAIDVTTAAPS